MCGCLHGTFKVSLEAAPRTQDIEDDKIFHAILGSLISRVCLEHDLEF